MVGAGLLKAYVIKALARFLIPNSYVAEVVELEAKRKLGKLGGGESIKLEVETVSQFMDRIDHPTPFVVFDVGANIGDYSLELIWSFPNIQIVAFEPSSEAFGKLAIRFQDNPNMTLVNCALGTMDGEANLYFDKAGSGLASLSQRNLDHLAVTFKKSEIINMTTGHTWVESNAQFPTFMKIDVEGHELDVLRGFGKHLDPIKIIQFEFGGCNIDSRTYFKDFWVFLNPKFDIYRITPNGPHLIPEYAENNESFMTSNFLAVRKK